MTSRTESDTTAELAADLLEMARGYQKTQVLRVAADLRLADLLAMGSRTTEELAAATSTDPSTLYRLLRVLASLGLLSEQASGFELTPLGALLQTGQPGSMRAQVLHQAGDMYSVWAELGYSVGSGSSAFPKVFGVSNWERREQQPDVNANFNAAQADNTRLTGTNLAESYPFPQQGMIVDVGGGNGTLLSLVLSRHPGLQGVVFDQPHVMEQAHQILAAAGVTDRCLAVAGDFFVAVPEGGDVYILSSVLHDWDDAQATEILQQCRIATTEAATLLIIDQVIRPGDSVATLADLHMLVTQGGRHRTETEWRSLLGTAGFHLTAIMPLGSRAARIIEALPV